MARPREDSMSIVFRDLLILLALLMLTLVVLLIPLIKVQQESTRTEIEKAAGDMIAEITWAPDSPADIDLWANAPKKNENVGYASPYGEIFNLVRDDLGRYRFSIVYYSDNGMGNTPVDVNISIRYREGRLMHVVYEERLTLEYPGQEKGVISFEMRDRQLIEESKSFEPFEIFHGTLRRLEK
ncbi:MAG: hypothetical protein AB2805_09255 [Candidatus Thiodiazotropha sp.]